MSTPARQHYTTQAADAPLPRETRQELALLFGVFVTARLMSVWWFRPPYALVASDFLPFAWLQGLGYYPFFSYWLEYPPVLSYVFVGLRALSTLACGRGSVAYESACLVHASQLFSIAAETGALALVYALAKLLRGPKAALRACWVYAALFSTAFVALSYVETFPMLLLLAAILLAVHSRTLWTAAVVGLGFMTKVLPVGLLPMVLKCEGKWRWRLAPLGVFLGAIACIAAPFVVTGRPWLLLSLESMARRAPWETVWALLDHRGGFGYVGPDRADQTEQFDARFGVAEAVRGVLDSVPPEVYGPPSVRQTIRYRVASRFATKLDFLSQGPAPSAAFLWIYGGVGLVLAVFFVVTFARLPSALPPRRRILFAAFCMFLLFFYAKGWSPQFIIYLVPLLLIVFPLGEGGLWALLLTVVNYVEMPVWLLYVHGQEGMLALDHLLLQGAVVARTVLLVIIIARLYPRLLRD